MSYLFKLFIQTVLWGVFRPHWKCLSVEIQSFFSSFSAQIKMKLWKTLLSEEQKNITSPDRWRKERSGVQSFGKTRCRGFMTVFTGFVLVLTTCELLFQCKVGGMLNITWEEVYVLHNIQLFIIGSLLSFHPRQGGYVFTLVCLMLGLFASQQYYANTASQISMKLGGEVGTCAKRTHLIWVQIWTKKQIQDFLFSLSSSLRVGLFYWHLCHFT